MERSVWVRVGHGVERLGERGERVWAEPAIVRKALAELLGVFPATHVQVDFDRVLLAGDGGWAGLLARSGGWGESLKELAQAIGSALRAPAVWGIGLPSPRDVAAAAGDASDRGITKAGVQLASFLQAFRDAPVGFVAVDVAAAPVEARAVAPLFRNAALYGWKRAATVADLAASRPDADAILVLAASLADLLPRWSAGENVAGGLDAAFWAGGALAGSAPPSYRLYGTVPETAGAKDIVEAGRRLRAWIEGGAA